ncbi:MAG TPA: methylenetetrahydrofolate reductase [Rhizomicrobium sp.]
MAASNSATSELTVLLADASIEVTPREPSIAQTLLQHFGPGTDVHVTFLPDDNPVNAAQTCARLRHAGYNPTPHLTARNFIDTASFATHLENLARDAQVERALLIAGDVDRPRGNFAASMDLIDTGLLEKSGLRTVLVAGHPEGHPAVDSAVLDEALQVKIAALRARGFQPEIVTQFGFEAEPIVRWISHLRNLGIDAPVRIGVAGPASTASLLKFAMRCGVGNSLRALRTRGGAIGKLMGDTTPEGLLIDLAAQLAGRNLGPIVGIHLYMFGGVRKTSEWLNGARLRADATGLDRKAINS